MEATAAIEVGSSTSGESAGTTADLSPETGKIQADKSEANASQSPPPSPFGDDTEVELAPGQKLKLAELKKEYARRREHERAASMKFDEAAALRKQVQSALSLINTDPEEALRRFGLDPVQVAQQTLAKRMQREQMSPEQREFEERKAAFEAREKELQEREGKIQEHQRAEYVRQWEQHYQRSFEKAAQSRGLPASPRVLARMAEIADSYIANDRDDVLFDDIADQVKDELQEENGHFLGQLDGKALLSVLPKNVIEQIRKELVAQVRQPQAQPQQQRAEPQPRQQRGFISMDEARAAVAKRAGV